MKISTTSWAVPPHWCQYYVKTPLPLHHHLLTSPNYKLDNNENLCAMSNTPIAMNDECDDEGDDDDDGEIVLTLQSNF